MLLAWLLPDRTRFTGDFVLRQGTTSLGKDPSRLFPQAMPFDVWLHFTLPRAAIARFGGDSNTVARLLGALEAGALALLARAFAGALGARGAAAVAAFACAFFGGALGLTTGYAKGLTELTLATLAVGAFGVEVARTGRGLLALGVAAALATAAHRSGAFTIGAVLAAWAVWLAVHAKSRGVRALDLAGFAVPLAAWAWLAPVVARQVAVLDRRHVLPAEAERLGVLSAAFGGGRALELANLAAALAPLLPAALLVLPWVARRTLARRECAVLAALAIPALAVFAFVHPLQGEFRDWDVFAPAALALALAAAAPLAAAHERAPAPLGFAAAMWAATPALLAVGLQANAPASLRRIEAWVQGPPERGGVARSATWDFLSTRAFTDARYDDAARAGEAAVASAPNPRYFLQWGMAETMRGDDAKAQALYRRAVELNPDFTTAWAALAAASSRLDDVAETARATAAVRRLDPNDERLPDLEDYLRRRGVSALAR